MVALILPVCLPLLSSQEVSGGDTFVYIPRLVEFHENIRNGIWLPRWAPDLGQGEGQPLFLFVPPLVYYFGEFWHLLGFDFASALECVTVATVVIAAFSMFFLGRLLFGSSGGWLAAAAYIYAPYFDVDLYVRRALGEFQAFAFYPIAIYGLVKFAAIPQRRIPRLRCAGPCSGCVDSQRSSAHVYTRSPGNRCLSSVAVQILEASLVARSGGAAFRSADGFCLVPQPRGNEVRAH